MEQEDLKELIDKVDKMYYALMGNEISKDGGLVGRIVKLEKGQDKIIEDIERIEKDTSKLKIYQKLIYGSAGIIIGFLVKIIFGV